MTHRPFIIPRRDDRVTQQPRDRSCRVIACRSSPLAAGEIAARIGFDALRSGRIVRRVQTILIALAIVAVAAPVREHSAAAQVADRSTVTARRVVVALPVTGQTASDLASQMRRVTDLPPSAERPVLVLEFAIGSDATHGQGSDLGACVSLSRLLMSPEFNRVRTIAWIPDRGSDVVLRGHAVLVALAAGELAMADRASIGDAGLDEAGIGPFERAAYEKVANQRRTLPVPMATAMVDAQQPLFRVVTPGRVVYVDADELERIESEHGASAAEQEELAEAVNRLRGSIGNLNREGRERLRTAFEQVDGHFRELFTKLFEGGQAHLALIDSDDPLEAGLEIFAQPPGKKLQSLTLLSGGEQALTATALIFALFLTNPAPICVLDEVDAPLDDANIDRFCDLLDSMVRETNTRYLIVTHNAVTMSRMHRLFGVTMVEQGISRLVSVNLGEAELMAAE